jgi:hypothetical protein
MSISFSPPKSGCAAADGLCHLNYETRHRRHAVALLDDRPFSMLSCKLSDYSLNVDNLIVSWNDQIGLEALSVTIHEGPANAP